ncbi:pentapeptide repeat-containing protein [Streptomyces sp. TLI_146]|uniref:pentapeptide repeat-containing protein n=1 Tax=Streptomyces sp. TLI_146 TaxID=1938858 RepID=UPI0015D60DA1|nr:pentapeptide repeat-containing protein [Streptomyces sp. TLI_146]
MKIRHKVLLVHMWTRARLSLLLAGVGVGVFVAVVLVLIWRGPWWVDGEYLSRTGLQDGSAALVTGFRTAIVQLAAVFGAGVALLFTAFNYRLSLRGQVTDRFTKALEHLGSEEMYGRMGGLLALEQIIKDAPDQSFQIVQVLNEFIRQRAPRAEGTRSSTTDRVAAARRAARQRTLKPRSQAALPSKPEADVQQAITLLVRSMQRGYISSAVVDLSGLHLAGAILTGADVWSHRGFYIPGIYRADLRRASFSGADLSGANLAHADLFGAELTGANLAEANLTGANLFTTKFIGANLAGARLDKARLVKTNFTGADLTGANIVGSDLTFTNFTEANLTEVDLAKADVRYIHLDGAIGLSAEQREWLEGNMYQL